MNSHSKHISPESFPYLLDEIFAGLASHFPPEIRFSQETNGQIRIVAVCGKEDAGQLLNLMKHRKAELLEKMAAAISAISLSDLDIFMDQAKRRMRRIMACFTQQSSGIDNDEKVSGMTWNPNRLRCKCDETPEADPRIVAEVISLTRRHAKVAYLLMTELDKRLNFYAGASIQIIHSTEKGPDITPKTRFRLNCTVSFLGTLFMVLIERNIIENPNITDLSRRIAALFCTPRQETISPSSLRNAVNCPDPQALEQLLNELQFMIRYVERTLERV
jgi:hypothetical protein